MNRLMVLPILVAALWLPLAAQTDEDAPGRGVARLSVMNGDVSIRRGDSGDYIAAGINAPLVVTDRLVTGSSSRAELQFDWSNMVRIGSNAEVRLSVLDARQYQIQVAIGTITFRVLRDSDAEVEISTPSVAVRPLGRGTYRVTVLEDGTSEITVRSGELEVYTPRGTERLGPRGTMLARGSATEPEFQDVAALPLDDWDRWNEDRDRMIERSRSYQYVPKDVYGVEDLDDHGRWVSVDEYGPVWVPAVSPGWSPYQLGRWAWVDYYGWTWVSYDPWGWAPYHYGRWFNSPRYGWCWWPGARSDRYHWSPALVAFFGWGNYGGFQPGVGFGYGHIGWVPLAPHEPFHPWYGRGFYSGHADSTVVINNTNIANLYRNSRAPNGITAVNREVFGRRAIARGDLVRVDAEQLRSAALVRGVLPVTPGRESLRIADRSVRVTSFRRPVESRTFYSRGGARAAAVTPFEQQRIAVQRIAERTFSNTSGISRAAGGRGSVEPDRSGNSRGTPYGWRRIGEPQPTRPTERMIPSRGTAQEQNGSQRSGDPLTDASRVARPSGQPSVTPASTGWRRFGDPGAVPRSYGNERGGATSFLDPGVDAARQEADSLDRRTRGYEYPAQTSSRPSEAQQPVRISPPIVRERPPSPSWSGGPRPASNGGGGGMSRGGGSAPPSRAPASRGGSGGGSSHGGGGRSRGR